MFNTKITYISVSQAIDDAVAKYKKNEPIEDCLSWINQDVNRLTGWAYETNSFFDNDDYVFLTSEDEIFITDDDLLSYFDADQLDLKEDTDILAFIYKRSEALFADDSVAAHFHYRDGLYLTADCEMWGQAGPHFFRFNIYSSKEKYFESLASKGNIFWDKTFSSHSDSELISMFKKNVTGKYFSS